MKKTNYEKEFLNIFEIFHNKYPNWKVWNDFLYLSAVSMANLFPSKEKKEREERYQAIWNQYSGKEQELFANLLATVTVALDDNPEQDFLGKLFHRLELHQQQKGQFFTPYNISHMMAELQFTGASNCELEDKGYITVMDSACGAGAMLIAFANVAKNHGINYQREVLFMAQDIDQTAALMCYVQLSILGCPAIIIVGDSLAKPGFHPDNSVWYTPFYYCNQRKFQEFFADAGSKTEEKKDNQSKNQKQKNQKVA